MPSILETIIEPDKGNLSSELARYILSLDFSKRQKARYRTLAYRAQDGEMTKAEAAELEDFVQINSLLMILQSKARRSLRRHNPAA